MLNQLCLLCRTTQKALHGKYFNKIAAQNREFDRPYFEVHYVHPIHLKTSTVFGKFTGTMIRILKPLGLTVDKSWYGSSKCELWNVRADSSTILTPINCNCYVLGIREYCHPVSGIDNFTIETWRNIYDNLSTTLVALYNVCYNIPTQLRC